MKARQKGFTTIAAALTAVAVIALGSAGIAGADPVSNPPGPLCNNTGRTFCIDVTTFQNITNTDLSVPQGKGLRYTWVAWKLTSTMQSSTLTHPTITITLADDCTATDPADCTGSTASFVPSTIPSQCKGGGTTLTCTYANLPPGGNTGTPPPRVYFKTKNAIPDASPGFTRIFVRGTVKERSSDANGCSAGDPNCDTHLTWVDNSYEPDANAAYTYALNGNSFHLETNDRFSSFEFKSLKSAPFQAKFVTSYPTTSSTCGSTPSPTCFFRTLTVTTEDPVTTGYNDGPVVFYARLTDLPSGVNANSVTATHEYDKVTFAVSSNRFSPPSGMDARLDTVKLESTGLTYFVVGVNTTTNTFQLSLTPGGPPVTTFSASETGVPTRIIGDQNFERTTKGCTFTYTNQGPNQIPVPSICAKKPQGLQALDVWVWDSSNGGIKFGGS